MLADARKAYDLIEPDRRWKFLAVLAGMVVTALLQTAGVASVMPFLALVADPEIVRQNPIMAWAYDGLGFRDTRQFMAAIGVGVILILAATNAFSAFSRWLTLRFAWGVHDRLSHRLFKRYLGEDYSFFLERNTSELNKNLLAEVRGVIDYVVIPYMDVLARGTSVVFLVGLLILVDPLLSLVAATTLTGAYLLVYLAVRHKYRDLGLRRHAAFGERSYLLAEAFGGIKDVKILEREDYFLSRLNEAAGRFSDANTKQSVLSEMPRFALETIAFGGIIATVIYLLETRQTLNLVLPIVGLYALAGYRLMPALQVVFAGISNIRFYSPMLSALHADLFAESAEGQAETPIELPASEAAPSVPSLEREIRFRRVGFRYPKAATPAIEDVDLLIPVRRTVALVGATGSGKTTLMDLLLGLFRPTTGEILIDDVALTPANLSDWRRMVGYVSQSIYLADNTIAHNIAFGLPPELVDREAVFRAAHAAHLDGFIQRLPNGYETVVGERGVRLSGGERQRIAIARALYRDPEVLVMDEATSALDGATEEAVMQAIGELSGKKTIVMIAHRLTTVRTCDSIFVMEDGRVVASGTYAELAADNAAFRSMARESASMG
jgi:ATP-binding cassette, subfamily B, bacterial PglK